MTQILAIETSCDETAAAVVEDGRHIRSNVVATQIELHRRFGGVFPEVASRQHVLAIQPVVQQALDEASVADLQALDAIAVTQGPGLAGSLLVGVNTAKGMSFGSGLPLLPINHLEGHIYSNWIETSRGRAAGDDFPTLVLIVSGGHTELILMRDHCVYERLGGTLDDAAGEAFDKIARLLGLGFPGGPAIQRAAAGEKTDEKPAGDPSRFDLPRPLMQYAGREHEHRFNFSFSGLKTAVLNLTRELADDGIIIDEPQVQADLAASFQQAVVDVLVGKTLDAAVSHGARQVCICGGVSANALLREVAGQRLREVDLPLHIPPLFLCTDNAAMIGAAAFYRWRCEPTLGGELGMDVQASLRLA